MDSKYINGGQQLVVIKDRAASGNAFTKSRRYVVWNETTQTTLSEHATRQAAEAALAAM